MRVGPGDCAVRRARENRLCELRRAGEELGAQALVGTRERRLQQLADDPEPILAFELAAAGRQHLEAVIGGARAGLAQQARLADPGGSLDQHDPPTALRRVAQKRRQLIELALALEQQRGSRRSPLDGYSFGQLFGRPPL